MDETFLEKLAKVTGNKKLLNVQPKDEAEALKRAASTLGVDPVDLGTIISFETGGTFDPNKVGGAGNKYRGLIQFGAQEQKSYYKPNQTFDEQLNDGVVRYFQDRYKRVGKQTQGATLEDLYTTVIAGNPNANRDAKDAFGTSARSGVQKMSKEHRQKVMERFFGGQDTVPTTPNFLDNLKSITGDVTTNKQPTTFLDNIRAITGTSDFDKIIQDNETALSTKDADKKLYEPSPTNPADANIPTVGTVQTLGATQGDIPIPSVSENVATIPSAPVTKLVAKTQPKVDNAEYQKYLKYTQKKDSPNERREFERLSAQEGFSTNVADYSVKSPRIEIPQDAYKEVPKDEDNLKPVGSDISKTIAGKVKIDLAQKPAGMSASEFASRAALKALAPRYGITDAQIDDIIQKYGGSILAVEMPALSDLTELELENYKRDGASVTVNRGLIAEIVGKDVVQKDFDKEYAEKRNAQILANPVDMSREIGEAQEKRYQQNPLDKDNPTVRKRIADEMREASPFGLTEISDATIDAEIEKRQQQQLTEGEQRRSETLGTALGAGIGGNEAAGVALSGFLGSGARGIDWLKGVYKFTPFELGASLFDTKSNVVEDEAAKISKAGKIIEEKAKEGKGFAGSIVSMAGASVGDLPRLALQTTVLGGVGGFALDSMLQSVGRGETSEQAFVETLRGGLTGAIFRGSGALGNMAKIGVLKNVLGGAEIQSIVNNTASAEVKATAIRHLFKRGVTLGSITGGLTTTGIMEGQTPKDAFLGALQVAMLDVVTNLKGDASTLKGKLIKATNPKTGEEVGAFVNEKGELETLKEVPKEADIELKITPKEIEKRTDAIIAKNQEKRINTSLGDKLKVALEAPKEKIKVKTDVPVEQKADFVKAKELKPVSQKAENVKPRELNFTQFAIEKGYPSDNDTMFEAQLLGARGLAGSISKRSIKEGDTRFAKMQQKNKQAHKEFEAAILSGEILDADGKITKEGLLREKSDSVLKKAKSQIEVLDNHIKFIEGLGRMAYKPNGELKIGYKRAVNDYNQQKAKIIEQFPSLSDKPAESIPKTTQGGKEVSPKTVTTERGTKTNIAPKVIEAADIITSLEEGYPSEFQPRDRTRQASKAQISDIANKLNPDFLGDSPKASDGRPLVVELENGKYAVISGNARSAAIKKAYSADSTPSQKYAEFTQSKETNALREPVYVGVLPKNIDLKTFAREANESTVAKMSATEQAKTDAEKLDTPMMQKFMPSEDGSIHSAANRDFIKDFMKTVPETERNALQQSDGSLSQEGVNRIRNAIIAKAYGERAVERIAESTDNNVKRITNALLHNAGRVAELKQAIDDGIRFEGLDISENLVKATEKFSYLRDEGTSVKEYLDQQTLFGDDLTPFEKRILSEFDNYKNSAKAVNGILDNYLAIANELGSPKQTKLFGEPVENNAATIFQRAVLEYEKGNEAATTQKSLFDKDKGRETQPQTKSVSETTSSKDVQSETAEAIRAKLKESTKTAVSETKEGVSEVGQALKEFLKTKDTLGAILPFSAETYAQMKPHLEKALTHFKVAGKSVIEIAENVALYLRNKAGMTTDEILNLSNYIEKFAQEVKEDVYTPTGKIKESQTPKTLRENDIPLEDRSYTSATNLGQKEFADQMLDKGVDKATEWIKQQVEDKNSNAGATTVVGLNLMQHLGKNGKIAEMNKIADDLVPFITESAQAIQAVSTVSMFDPSSAGAYAGKVKKQRTGKDLTKQEFAEATRIAETMQDVTAQDGVGKALVKEGRSRLEQMQKELDAYKEAVRVAESEKVKIDIDLSQAKAEIAKLKKQTEGKTKVVSKTSANIAFDRALSSASETARETVAAFTAVKKGLVELFPPDTFANAGFPAFDSKTYTKAKPYFREALGHFNQASRSSAETVQNVVKFLREQIGLSEEHVKGLRAYIMRFANDVEKGTVRTPFEIEFDKSVKEAGKLLKTDKYADAIIRQGVENNYSDEVIFHALARKHLKTPGEVESALLKEFPDLTKDGVRQVIRDSNLLTQNAKQAVKEARLQIQNNFKLTQKEVRILEKEKLANDVAKRQLTTRANRFYDSLTKGTGQVVLETAVNYRKANLLTGIKTHLKNVSSNTANLTAEEMIRPVSALADIAASFGTGERTVQGISPKGVAQGFKNLLVSDKTLQNADMKTGFSKAWHIIRWGDTFDHLSKQQLSESNLRDKFNTLKIGSIADGYINFVFRTLSAEDALFKVYAFRRSLEEQASTMSKSEDGNKLFKTKDSKAIYKNLIENPTNLMQEMAREYAEEATYQNDNPISTFFARVKSYNPVLKAGAEILIPFDRTPTNIVLRTLEYTPYGLGKSVYEGVKGIKQSEKSLKKFGSRYRQAIQKDLNTETFQELSNKDKALVIDKALSKAFTRSQQQQFARLFGRGATGTFAAIPLGFVLASHGLLAGVMNYDESDKEETSEYFDRRKAGVENRSLLIPGVGRFTLTDEPFSRALSFGATMFEQSELARKKKKDAVASVMDGTSESISDVVFEQPLMREVRDQFRWNSVLGQRFGNLSSGFIPVSGMLNQIGEAIDPKARKMSGYTNSQQKEKSTQDIQWTGFRNSFFGRVPVARQFLVPESTTSVSDAERNTIPANAPVPQFVRDLNTKSGGFIRRFARTLDPFNIRSAQARSAEDKLNESIQKFEAEKGKLKPSQVQTRAKVSLAFYEKMFAKGELSDEAIKKAREAFK